MILKLKYKVNTDKSDFIDRDDSDHEESFFQNFSDGFTENDS